MGTNAAGSSLSGSSPSGQTSGLPTLSNLELQARHAFAGWTDPGTGDLQEGAAWIFDNIERLTTLDVTAYTPH